MNNFEKFHKRIHFWGRITVGIAFLLSLSIPIYLTFVRGYVPKFSDIITGMISITGFVGIVWIVEPISYFPVLGPAGTYMSFLSGNIGNMRLPVIAATQDALDLEAGSDKSELAGIFALAASIITNLFILAIVMVAGQVIVNALPPDLLASFNYALPGILGAMLVMLGSKIKRMKIVSLLILAAIILAFIKFSPNFLPANVVKLISIGDVGIVAVFGIIFALISANKDKANA